MSTTAEDQQLLTKNQQEQVFANPIFDDDEPEPPTIEVYETGTGLRADVGNVTYKVPDEIPRAAAAAWAADHHEGVRIAQAFAGKRFHAARSDSWTEMEEASGMEQDPKSYPPNPHDGMALDGFTPPRPGTASILRDAGEIVQDWSSPHHGRGQAGCCSIIQERATVNAKTESCEWKRAPLRCGARDCQDCGPVRDDEGRIKTAGTWEIRTARRAADKAEAHRIDRQRGLLVTSRRKVCPPCKKQGAKKQGCRDCRQERHVENKRWNLHKKPILFHLSVSPPPDAWDNLPWHKKTRKRLAALKRTATRHLMKLGINGGYTVTHSHRIPGRFNDRTEAAEGLHWHVLGVHKKLLTYKLDGAATRWLYAKTGWIVENIPPKADENDPCPDPNRDAFGTLVYLLSHSTWPNYAGLRDAGERSYPAWMKSATRPKAIVPFGFWVLAPESRVFTGLDEDRSPVSGEIFAAEDWYDAKFDKPPPKDVEYGFVPKGWYRVDHSERCIHVRVAAYARHLGGVP